VAVHHLSVGIQIQEEHVARECPTSPQAVRHLFLGAGTKKQTNRALTSFRLSFLDRPRNDSRGVYSRYAYLF
jgi:hypothetical protein